MAQLVLLAAATTAVTNGAAVGIQIDAYNPNVLKGRTVAVNITLNGGGAAATATVIVEESNDASSWNTLGSNALSTAGGQVGPQSNSVTPASSPLLYTTYKKFLRASLTAVSGASPTVNAMMELKGGD
jgi:hypothetical protein